MALWYSKASVMCSYLLYETCGRSFLWANLQALQPWPHWLNRLGTWPKGSWTWGENRCYGKVARECGPSMDFCVRWWYHLSYEDRFILEMRSLSYLGIWNSKHHGKGQETQAVEWSRSWKAPSEKEESRIHRQWKAMNWKLRVFGSNRNRQNHGRKK